MDADKFEEYFEDMAIHNKAIAHTPESRRFARLNIEEVLSGMRGDLDLSNWCLILEMYEGRLSENNSDNIMDNQASAFMVIKSVTQGDFSQERLTLKDAKIIAFQFLKKIRKDARVFPKTEANRYNGLVKNFDINTVGYNKVGPVFDNCFGFRIEFSFSESISMAYDPNDFTYPS